MEEDIIVRLLLVAIIILGVVARRQQRAAAKLKAGASFLYISARTAKYLKRGVPHELINEFKLGYQSGAILGTAVFTENNLFFENGNVLPYADIKTVYMTILEKNLICFCKNSGELIALDLAGDKESKKKDSVNQMVSAICKSNPAAVIDFEPKDYARLS